MTPATPYPRLARPTSHWNLLVGQPIEAAVGTGMNKCPVAKMIPLTPTSQVSPISRVVTFQSSTPPKSATARLTKKPASGSYKM
jgi:hypothetical protein